MVKYLPDMCDNLDSQRIPITGSDRKTGSIPYYGASGVVDYVEKYIFDEELLLVSEDGANLVMRNSPIAFSVSGKTWVNNHAHVLRFSDQWLRQYVELYLNSISLEPYITGTAQPKLNQQMLNNIPIPVPDESQIRYIVTCTTCVHKLISLRKQQIAKLDELVKARFVEMFGDQGYPYQDLITLISDGAGLSYGIVQPGDDGTGDMGVLRPVDIVDGHIVTESIKYIDRTIGDGFRKTELTGDELLITVRGTTGITALTDGRFAGMNVTRGIAVIRFDRIKINPNYLNAYLQCDESQSYIQEHTRGATLKQINLSDLRIQPILVPPRSLQDQFAAFVAQTDQQKLTIQRSLDKLELMKKALMQKYFG